MRRWLVGIGIGVLGLGCALTPPSWALLVLAIALGSLFELERLVKRKGAGIETPVALIAVVLYLVLTYFDLIRRYESDLLAATVVFALGFAAFTGKGNAISRSGYTLLSVLYVGKLTSYFIAIRNLPEVGLALTIFVMVAIVATDTFAMVVGRSIGRHRLSKLSPQKTWEGAAGGFAAACCVGVVFSFVGPLHLAWWQAAAIAALTSLAAQAGDLVESALKRDAKVKDAGSALYGHGGLLDRFDSFLFGGIAFYFALWLAGFAVPELRAVMHVGTVG